MTVSSTVNKTQANGNGSTSAFPFTFKFTASSEIEVYVDDTLKTLSTHYTLSLPGDSGTVTFLTAPTDFRPQTGEVVTIRRIQSLTQTFDPTAGGGLSSSSVEGSDDNLLMKIQQVDEQSDRAPRLKATTETGQLTFPEPVASAVIAYNAAGTDLETKGLADIDGITTPASSTDEAIVRFDGTSGLSFQNSGVTIDDSNNVTGVVRLSIGDVNFYLELAAGTTPQLLADAGDALQYNRTANAFVTVIGGTDRAAFTSAAIRPAVDDGIALGSTAEGFSDLFVASGFTLNIANGNWLATHTSGVLTVGTGDLRVTTAGTNDASVATVGGTQTLTAKTVNLANNTLTGTAAQFDTACSDDNFLFASDLGTTVREAITANRTYYVRTDGSDSNTGLVDSAGGAFLTIQAAIDAIAALDIGDFNVDIEVRDGTYTGTTNVFGSWVGTGVVTINGESASGTIISTTSADCLSATNGARLTVNDVELRTTTGGNALSADSSSVILFSGIRFGACAGHQIQASNGAVISAAGNYAIVGNAVSHLHAPFGGFINISGVTVTLSGTPAFSGFFAGVSGPSNITAVSTTFSGSATGARYIIYKSGHIETNGANPASYFPGNAAGALGSGGTLDTQPMVDPAYVVANLPTASLFAGARALVVDANATTFASVVAGGGANIVPVYSTGSNWVIG